MGRRACAGSAKASVIESKTKKKVHVGVQHDSREKMIIPKQEVAEPVNETQLSENEDSLPECVKKFLKRKRTGPTIVRSSKISSYENDSG